MIHKTTHVLLIRRDHLEQLGREARKVWPLEACALLIGLLRDEVSEVLEIEIAKNIDESSVTFRVDPMDLYQIYSRVEAEGKNIIGIFHSHPAPPSPSSIDRQYLKVNPVIWLIMSMPGGSIGAYRWSDESVQEVEVSISEW